MATNNNNIYQSSSPYYLSSIAQNKFLDVMINRPIPSLASDILWTITTVYEYRPDLLAYDLYNDSRLWWVFAQRNPNRLKDPYFDFITGKEIYIPVMSTLKSALGI
jgi:hypothetical protein